MSEFTEHLLHRGDLQQWLEILFKFVLAALLAGALGLERETRGRPAGLRTHILVCLGATMLMVVSGLLADEFNRSAGQTWLDRGRIAAGIITGIGFLGAGTIVQTGRQQRGLTTAAMIWFAACLGIAIGCGYYLLSILSTALALFVIVGLGFLERRLTSRDHLILHLHLPQEQADIGAVTNALHEAGALRASATRIRYANGGPNVVMAFQVDVHSERDFARVVEGIRCRFPDAQVLEVQR